jgi:hypothetical protein
MSKSVTPSLVYGGPWFANTGFDNDANEFVITEASGFYAHNECCWLPLKPGTLNTSPGLLMVWGNGVLRARDSVLATSRHTASTPRLWPRHSTLE